MSICGPGVLKFAPGELEQAMVGWKESWDNFHSEISCWLSFGSLPLKMYVLVLVLTGIFAS